MKNFSLLVMTFMWVSGAQAAGDFSAFSSDHAGQRADTLTVTALGDTVHGLILHDGQCAYTAEAKLGCFDPRSIQHPLGCGRPQVASAGSVWLYLHGVALAPFDGGSPVYRALPIWAFSHVVAANGRDVYVWGMGEESAAQELWRWNITDDLVEKISDGPADLSGGIARLRSGSSDAECLLLSTYKPVDQVCEGMTTVYKFCGSDLEKFSEFKGCSSRVAGTDHAVFNYGQTGIVKYQNGASEVITFRSMHLDSWVPLTGDNPREVLFDGRRVTVLRH